VRELENAIERALLLSDRTTLEPGDFDSVTAPSVPAVSTGIKLAARAISQEAQRRLIRAALEATGGNVTHAAERLGLSRRGLQIKMKQYGLRAARRPE
jgi:two-component system response regulator HydG